MYEKEKGKLFVNIVLQHEENEGFIITFGNMNMLILVQCKQSTYNFSKKKKRNFCVNIFFCWKFDAR